MTFVWSFLAMPAIALIPFGWTLPATIWMAGWFLVCFTDD